MAEITVRSKYLQDISSEPEDCSAVGWKSGPRIVYYGCFTRDPKEIAATLIRPKAPRPTQIRDAQSMLIQFAKLLDDRDANSNIKSE